MCFIKWAATIISQENKIIIVLFLFFEDLFSFIVVFWYFQFIYQIQNWCFSLCSSEDLFSLIFFYHLFELPLTFNKELLF